MPGSLRVAAAHRPPYVLYDPSAPVGGQFTGLLVELLPILLKKAGVSNPYTLYNPPDNEGGTFINGTWNGMIGELVSERAQMVLFPLTLTQERVAYIDFTYSYVDGGIGLLVRGPQSTATALGFLRPFSWQVWVCLLITLLLVIVLLHILARLSPLGLYDVKAIRSASSRSGPPVEYTIDPGNSLWVAACWAMVSAPLLPRGRSWSIRILQLAFGFFCTVIVNTYTASLASLLTVENLSQPISSLQQLLRAAGPFVISPKGSTYTYFQSTLDPVAQALIPNMLFKNDPDDGMHAVQSGEALAFMTDYSTLQYYQTEVNCKLVVAGDPFGPGNLALGLQKGSSLTTRLNKAMLTLRGDGTVDVLQRRWLPADFCSGAGNSDGGSFALEIRAITGLFYFLLLVVAIAFLWTAAERLSVWYGSKRPTTFKRIKTIMSRFWWAEQHHKNITLSRRFSEAELPPVPEDGNVGEGSTRSTMRGSMTPGVCTMPDIVQAFDPVRRTASLDSVPENAKAGNHMRSCVQNHQQPMPVSSSPSLGTAASCEAAAVAGNSPSRWQSPFALVSGLRPSPESKAGADAVQGLPSEIAKLRAVSRTGSRRLLLWSRSSAQSADLDQGVTA